MPDVNPDIGLVRALVAAAGLRPSPAEIETMAAAYPALRGAADRLQQVAGDADPAPAFDPVPLFAGEPFAEESFAGKPASPGEPAPAAGRA